jgi:CheY-like chemotaxis protein
MTASACRILVVDDDSEMRDLLVSLLEKQGHMVVQAVSGEVALALVGVAQAPFDLLVSDIQMPGMKGTELARRVLEIHPRMHVLMISVDDAERDTVAGSSFLLKPLTPVRFLQTVETILGGRSQRVSLPIPPI